MAIGSPTPSILHGPTSKEKKYDRQLRLWGANGQAALEDARLLLVNSGPGVVGVETLKNLVLPGIGNFTILDSSLVSEADRGVNFFLEEEHLGGFRAEHTCNLLKELNPDVSGSFIKEPLETFLTQPNALTTFTHILVTAPIRPELLQIISSHCVATETPLLHIHSVGFYTHFSISLPPAFPVVDTHPDPTSTQDLRLLAPWPALSELVQRKTAKIDNMDDDDHGHIPYVLLLLHYLEVWKAEHEGKVPGTYKEKTEFRDRVSGATRRQNAEGGEENFDEAVAAVVKSLNPPSASSDVKEAFSSPECQNLSSKSASFWVIANAVSTFHSKNGVLPLPGAVPDMKARSKDYIELQTVYKTKARHDIAEVTENVRLLEKQLGRVSRVDDQDIEAFCKGAQYIKLVRGRPINVVQPGSIVDWGGQAQTAVQLLTQEFPDPLFALYIAFLAYDDFIATHTANDLGGAPQVPGAVNVEVDAEKMAGIGHKIVDNLINEAGTMIDDPEYSQIKEKVARYTQELTRAGGAELHNISSLAGGIVAQEVIKVITKQYTPVDNTCLFDGVVSKSSVIRL